MDAFQSSDNASTQKTFWTVLGILSGLTYIIAGIGLFGANTSVQTRLEWMKRSKSQVTGARKDSYEEKVGFGGKKITPWFGKMKQIWMKSLKGIRGPIANTQGDIHSEQSYTDSERSSHSEQSDTPPV